MTIAWIAAIIGLLILYVRAQKRASKLRTENIRLQAQSEEVAQIKRDFVSYVSHELKAPLASMQETTQLLLERIPGPLTDKQRRLLELNLQSGKKLAGMISNVLDLSRLEASIVDYDMHAQDLVEVLHNAITDIEAAAARENVEMEFSLQPEPIIVRCDTARTMQLLGKVLENSVRFSNKGMKVRIDARIVDAPPPGLPPLWEPRIRSTSSKSGFALVSITDSGPGIPNENKESVFHSFQHGRQAKKTHVQGLGLGLPIARVLVEAHHGAIWVEDNPGGGSVFQILLPRAEEDAVDLRRSA